MTVEQILKNFEPIPENLMPILKELQKIRPQNRLTADDIRQVARYLKMPYSRVYGVASYCSILNLEPRGLHVIKVCDSPACQLMGASTVLEELKNLLGISENETTPDGLFTLETTSCLGVCGVAPAMVVDEEIFGNLTPDRIREIISEYRGRESK
jgi:NADH-quinone oxidoreductase subunit E